MNTPWWERTDLRYRRGRLHLGTHDLANLARSAGTGTPVYAYHAPRIAANFRRLRRALAAAVRQSRVFYAMKSNRFVPVLGVLRGAGAGVDVCSPEELLLARQCGFREDQISFTGTSLSEDDARVLARHPGVILNCDSLASLRRIARLAPGRSVGLRINPGLGLGYRSNRLLRYAGGDVTKFGIYAEQFPAALALAREAGLRVNGLHFHTGCGFLTPQLPVLDRIFTRVRDFIRQAPPLDYVNLGGGLGIPLTASDAPLDLARWSAVVRKHFGRDRFTVCVEPGDYLVKDSGVLLLEVNTVEEKAGTRFVGVNGGFNIHIEPAFYALPLEPVPVLAPSSPASAPTRRVTIAGNINEALDIWARNVRLPRLAEGDVLAFLNAGGYGTAMSSQHCLRGAFREYLLP